jgi:hypothetical protein
MRVAIFAALVIVAAGLTAGVATGAPVNSPQTAAITITCPSGSFAGVVTLVSGEWTPAHSLDSNAVFIPIAFGEFIGTATDPDGNVLFTVDEPPLVKGSSVPQNGKLQECTGLIEFDFPGGHFTGSSPVTGFIAPA